MSWPGLDWDWKNGSGPCIIIIIYIDYFFAFCHSCLTGHLVNLQMASRPLVVTHLEGRDPPGGSWPAWRVVTRLEGRALCSVPSPRLRLSRDCGLNSHLTPTNTLSPGPEPHWTSHTASFQVEDQTAADLLFLVKGSFYLSPCGINDVMGMKRFIWGHKIRQGLLSDCTSLAWYEWCKQGLQIKIVF